MTDQWNSLMARRAMALAIALCLLAPVVALPAASAQAQFGRSNAPAQQRQGMSKGKKVALVAGAALLYYLWKKHNANKQQQQQAQGGMMNGQQQQTTMASARRPQLYRSKNGGIYYRDAQNKPVWLTVPSRAVQVPVEDLQRYAPDYNRYRGPAPSAPSGYRTESFSRYDPSLSGVFDGGSGGSSNGVPPGPRGGRM